MAVSIQVLSSLPTQSIDVRVTTLCKIKNHIAGHELRKQEFVQAGLIACVDRLLEIGQQTRIGNGGENNDFNNLLTQAANITCVIAHGGPVFVQPLLCSGVISRLLSCIHPQLISKPACAILRCLNAVADNLPLSSPDVWTPDQRLASLLYSDAQLQCFGQMINQTTSASISQRICDSILALICKTCFKDSQRQAMVKHGILSALCNRLASFVVAEGLVISNQTNHGEAYSEKRNIPESAPGHARLSPVLETIAVVIETMKTSALATVSDPAILSVLPHSIHDFSPTDIRKSPWGVPYFSGGAVPKMKINTPLDFFLPDVPDVEHDRKQQTNFPPLSAATTILKRRTSSIRTATEVPAFTNTDDNVNDEEEFLLIPWLLYIVRTYRGRRRLVAARLLVILDRYQLVPSSRSHSFRALLAPLLIEMLDDAYSEGDESKQLLTRMVYVEAVPSVLSCLIEDDQEMQKIAYDSKAIPKLAIGLKRNFDQTEDHTPTLWKPKRQAILSKGSGLQECILGSEGPSLEARHAMVSREGLLAALAAIAPDDDQYRKEICDQGVLTQIMLALEPFHSNINESDKGSSPMLIGNSAKTLLAACNAIRALTRSVTALRTKLVDADVGKAMTRLMHNNDPEVRIAATKVITNLVIDFSPMKMAISEPTIVKKLCEQVHSANARLRHESIWALKNLVVNSPNQLKREIIDELGANWIRHLIATDPYDIPPGEVIGLVEREYPPRGEVENSNGDVIMGNGLGFDTPSASNVSTMEDSAHYYNKHTVEDDLAIQEQLIDLIRNLFCGESASEIVEYLLGEIGQDEFVRILVNRLRPRVTTGATRRNNQMSTAPRDIVLSVLHLIVHVAAAAPKFRNMLTTNSVLMKQIAGYCTHSDHRIRVQVCWIIINLTYEDDITDRNACRKRVEDLHKLGFTKHVRDLENDPTADVRERAKTAVHLLGRQTS